MSFYLYLFCFFMWRVTFHIAEARDLSESVKQSTYLLWSQYMHTFLMWGFELAVFTSEMISPKIFMTCSLYFYHSFLKELLLRKAFLENILKHQFCLSIFCLGGGNEAEVRFQNLIHIKLVLYIEPLFFEDCYCCYCCYWSLSLYALPRL